MEPPRLVSKLQSLIAGYNYSIAHVFSTPTQAAFETQVLFSDKLRLTLEKKLLFFSPAFAEVTCSSHRLYFYRLHLWVSNFQLVTWKAEKEGEKRRNSLIKYLTTSYVCNLQYSLWAFSFQKCTLNQIRYVRLPLYVSRIQEVVGANCMGAPESPTNQRGRPFRPAFRYHPVTLESLLIGRANAECEASAIGSIRWYSQDKAPSSLALWTTNMQWRKN